MRTEDIVWADWFMVVKVPVVKVEVGDQLLFFTPTRRVESLGELYSVLRKDVWRIIRVRSIFEASFSEEVRLFEYLAGEELPVEARVLSAECGWRGVRERARHLPVLFKVVLHDAFWDRRREVEARGVLELYSTRAEVRVVPSPGVLGYREEVVVNGREFVRVRGLFTALDEYEPFTPKDDELERELALPAPAGGLPAPKIRRRRRMGTLSGYMDLAFFLREEASRAAGSSGEV
ncbi:MAG: hypothetical protein LM590_08300 [Thermofilum sp.]|nr:hypothetical protein [Thermofilum sp.]